MNSDQIYRTVGLITLSSACRTHFEAIQTKHTEMAPAYDQIRRGFGSVNCAKAYQRGTPMGQRLVGDLSDSERESIEAQWELATPFEEVIALPGGDYNPETGVPVSVLRALMGGVQRREEIGTQIKLKWPELAPDIERMEVDVNCHCRKAVRRSIAVRWPFITKMCDEIVAGGGSDPRTAPALEIPQPLNDKNKLNGVGEVFECDDDKDSFRVLMQEIDGTYRYHSAQFRKHPVTAGRLQIFLM